MNTFYNLGQHAGNLILNLEPQLKKKIALQLAYKAGAKKRRKEENKFINQLWGLLQGAEEEDPQALDELEKYGDFFELEIMLRQNHHPGIDRWFSRLEVGEVEYGRPEINNETILEGNEEDPFLPIFDTEMDGEWWENQFNTPSKLSIRKTDEFGRLSSIQWLPNWEHIKPIEKIREKNFQELLSLIWKTKTISSLKNLTGRTKFLSAQAAFGIKDKKNPKLKRFNAGVDYRRYAEIMNSCAKKACQIKGFHKGASLFSQLYYSENKEWAVTVAKKLNLWLEKELPDFKAFPIKVYEKFSQKEGEDIYDHGARRGEFYCDKLQKVPCKCMEGLLPNGVICPVCQGYGEDYSHKMRERLALLKAEHSRLKNIPRQEIQNWRMTSENIEEWLQKNDIQEENYTSKAFVKLNELFNFSYDEKEEKIYVYTL